MAALHNVWRCLTMRVSCFVESGLFWFWCTCVETFENERMKKDLKQQQQQHLVNSLGECQWKRWSEISWLGKLLRVEATIYFRFRSGLFFFFWVEWNFSWGDVETTAAARLTLQWRGWQQTAGWLQPPPWLSAGRSSGWRPPLPPARPAGRGRTEQGREGEGGGMEKVRDAQGWVGWGDGRDTSYPEEAIFKK